MPGRHVTDQQAKLFMTFRHSHTFPVAAAKAGMSKARGSPLEVDLLRPSQKRAPRGRRRPDPLEGIFDLEVVPLLKSSPGTRTVAIYEELLRHHPNLAPISGGRWGGGYGPGKLSMVTNTALLKSCNTTRKHDAQLATHRTSRSCTGGTNKKLLMRQALAQNLPISLKAPLT